MRVVFCSDTVGSLSSLEAGRVMAGGWPQAQVAVVPIGEAGVGFVQAAADRIGAEVVPTVVEERLVVVAGRDGVVAIAQPGSGLREGPIPYEASSRPLGLALRDVLGGSPRTVWVDLSSDDVHDGGAGLLAALGATADVPLGAGVAGLAGLTTVDLEPARATVGSTRLVGVVPSQQRDQPLLGLRGITSLRGRAAGADPEPLLATDAALAALAAAMGVGDRPGAGAAGGVSAAVLALGGRLATGPDLALGEVRGPADLVVTGCPRFDFASRGGGVVAAAAALAERLLCPCVVLAEEVLIGGREMRTMGIEAAYGIEGPFSVDRLRRLSERVGRTWRW